MTRSAITVLAAAVTALSLTLVPGAPAAQAREGAACAPTTRSIDTLPYPAPNLLSPRGHVVAEEGEPAAGRGLWLHRPNGTNTTINFADGSSPQWPSDVSVRGVTVGSTVHFPTLRTLEGWISKGGSATWLQQPTGIRSYMALSVNGSGAVAGVTSNHPDSSPGNTDFEATPVVWASADAVAQELPMPTGAFRVGYDNEVPLVSIRRDGLVSAVLDDYDGGGSYLARWRPGAAEPRLDQLPAGWNATSVANRWVVGHIGAGLADKMFVFSPAAAVQLDAPNGFTAMHVSANGTYSAVYGPGSIFGRGTSPPRDGIQVYQAVDIVGTNGGTALRSTPMGVSVISCVLGLGEAAYVDVTPVDLGG